MKFHALPIAGAFVVAPDPRRDGRGFFSRVYGPEEYAEIGHRGEIVQVNHSMTLHRGAARGLHYQLPPHAERKIVKCIRGNVFDVVLDLRQGSPTLLRWAGHELSAKNMEMIYVPEGCAHGFQALGDGCEILYLTTALYNEHSERGVRVDDPAAAIAWPLPLRDLSQRDRSHALVDPATFTGVSL